MDTILHLGVCCRRIVFIFCLQHVLWQISCFIILKNCVLQIRRCFFQSVKSFYWKWKLQYIEFQFLKGFCDGHTLFKISTPHKEKNNLLQYINCWTFRSLQFYVFDIFLLRPLSYLLSPIEWPFSSAPPLDQPEIFTLGSSFLWIVSSSGMSQQHFYYNKTKTGIKAFDRICREGIKTWSDASIAEGASVLLLAIYLKMMGLKLLLDRKRRTGIHRLLHICRLLVRQQFALVHL